MNVNLNIFGSFGFIRFHTQTFFDIHACHLHFSVFLKHREDDQVLALKGSPSPFTEETNVQQRFTDTCDQL